jgi:hypothetical protein
MLDERHHIYKLISSVSTIHTRVASHTWSSFRGICCLSGRIILQSLSQVQEMTVWDLQATAICARLALFGGDESEGVESPMVSLESHGTSDGGVADHRDVVTGKCTTSESMTISRSSKTHYTRSSGLFFTRLESGVAYAVLLPYQLSHTPLSIASASWDRQNPGYVTVFLCQVDEVS